MTIAFRCGHSHGLAQCATTGCRKPATVLCRYPVRSRATGRTKPCNRMVCVGCASAERYCPPHARGIETGKVEPLVTICSVCFTASCHAGEHRCPAPGPARKVTASEWKRLLCFGVP